MDLKSMKIGDKQVVAVMIDETLDAAVDSIGDGHIALINVIKQNKLPKIIKAEKLIGEAMDLLSVYYGKGLKSRNAK
jgi:hypothetical protein